MSAKRKAGLIAIGASVPEKVITNFDLEKIVDTSDEWIKTRTGISERRMADASEATSDLATKAARKALERANLTPDDIDLIILATATPDFTLPATAPIVQDNLGCKNAAAFDLIAGCTGWVYALSVAKNYVENGCAKNVLVIGSDIVTKIVDWTDRATCVLFGDGAGCGIVSAVEEPYGMYDFVLGCDGAGASSLNIPAGGTRTELTHELLDKHDNKVKMNGREVFKFAVKVQGDATEMLLEKVGLKMDDINLVIPHQANIRIIDSAVNRLGLPIEKFYVNVDRYGNTSTASIPIALNEAYEKGMVKKGDNILLVGFGAGLTWGAGVMKWAY